MADYGVPPNPPFYDEYRVKAFVASLSRNLLSCFVGFEDVKERFILDILKAYVTLLAGGKARSSP